MLEDERTYTKNYPGSIAQFTAQMQRLARRYNQEWRSSRGEWIRFEHVGSTDARGTWVVTSSFEMLSRQALEDIAGLKSGWCDSWSTQEKRDRLDVLRSKAGNEPEPEQGGYACIEAYEQTRECTLVDFVNGRDPRKPTAKCQMIEDVLFVEFLSMVIREIWPTNIDNLDPTDKRILEWVTDDPDLTDQQIGQRLNISRQAVNTRRRKLEAMNYKVR